MITFRMMVVMVSIPYIQVAEDKVLAVTCLHLDHKLEPRLTRSKTRKMANLNDINE